jgi:hypothetical protein
MVPDRSTRRLSGASLPNVKCGRRSPISADLRALIRRISLENKLWEAPYIHGELLRLGFTVAQPTTWPSRMMVGRAKLGQPSCKDTS